MEKPRPAGEKTVTVNRKAQHDYHILETLEAGIALTGTEIKSIRDGRVSIREAYVRPLADELWLVGAHIPEYSFGNRLNHPPLRDRKLLAHRREIRKLHKAAREKGITMVPLEVYFSGSRVKVLVGLCRGKRQHDKRQATKAREDQRDMQRALRRRR